MTLRVALAQVNPVVGDLAGNAAKVLAMWQQAAEHRADLIVFTELVLTGYPPEDLLLKPEFIAAGDRVLAELARSGPARTVAIVGCVGTGDAPPAEERWDVTVAARADLRNRAAVLRDGRVDAVYDKWRLPNYGVFDEGRYFTPDADPLVIDVGAARVGITVCEDLWTDEGPLAASAADGAQVIVNLNASPYHRGKRAERERWVTHHATRLGVWVVYVNQVGGQDELVFDGDSMLCGPTGTIVARGAQFADDLVIVDLAVGDLEDGLRGAVPDRTDVPRLDPVAEVWAALVLGTRDYCHKNGFPSAVIGLSGGIDSAVTAAIAVDALGAENVLGVAMPSPHSSDHSLDDAEQLATTLGIGFEVVPIEPAMKAFDEMVDRIIASGAPDVARENLQSRARGVVLMAISNALGHIVLTTGNKSEMAVGYATLYGDMAGGFAVLKDCPKTLVYELARHRNRVAPVIPTSSIDKPPSAELRPDQLDTDSLPPYELLDPILEALVEDDRSVADLVAAGFDDATVRRIARMVDRAEYKRRQAPPGVKITDRAFGKDRRVPITNAWRGDA